MPGDNPFAEPEDPDLTMIRPVPGGRRPGSGAPSGKRLAPTAPPAPAAGPIAAPLAAGALPLAAAAAPLLQLLCRLRNTLTQPDPGELRERALRELETFARTARDGGAPAEQIDAAHYALCASLDDVVLATPWGSRGAWAARPLTATCHAEAAGGDRFFELLSEMRQSPARFLPVLELWHACLSLGFQGRYRRLPSGAAELEAVRAALYRAIAQQRPAASRELSPHWRGERAPYRPSRARLPVWVAAAGGLALTCGVFAWISFGLAGASDSVFALTMQAAPAQMPQIVRAAPVQPPSPPPAPTEPDALDRLRGALQSEIARGLVAVAGTDAVPIVRLYNRGVFASGSAAFEPHATELLQRVGNALKNDGGTIRVIGYTDNQPIHSIKFPSSFELSAARARAVAEILGRVIGAPSRVTAEGRGSADPIASNATPPGREQNRRTDVVLRREP